MGLPKGSKDNGQSLNAVQGLTWAGDPRAGVCTGMSISDPQAIVRGAERLLKNNAQVEELDIKCLLMQCTYNSQTCLN